MRAKVHMTVALGPSPVYSTYERGIRTVPDARRIYDYSRRDITIWKI